jgi:hypothetical protein
MIGRLLLRRRIVAGRLTRGENCMREGPGQRDRHGPPSAGWRVVPSSSPIQRDLPMPTPRRALGSLFAYHPDAQLRRFDAIDVATRHRPDHEIETNRDVHATNERLASRHSAGKSTQARRGRPGWPATAAAVHDAYGSGVASSAKSTPSVSRFSPPSHMLIMLQTDAVC